MTLTAQLLFANRIMVWLQAACWNCEGCRIQPVFHDQAVRCRLRFLSDLGQSSANVTIPDVRTYWANFQNKFSVADEWQAGSWFAVTNEFLNTIEFKYCCQNTAFCTETNPAFDGRVCPHKIGRNLAHFAALRSFSDYTQSNFIQRVFKRRVCSTMLRYSTPCNSHFHPLVDKTVTPTGDWLLRMPWNRQSTFVYLQQVVGIITRSVEMQYSVIRGCGCTTCLWEGSSQCSCVICHES